ncbi:MAG: hypothetical protein R3F11_04115 [Verrucomicrobiales bacterium]
MAGSAAAKPSAMAGIAWAANQVAASSPTNISLAPNNAEPRAGRVVHAAVVLPGRS